MSKYVSTEYVIDIFPDNQKYIKGVIFNRSRKKTCILEILQILQKWAFFSLRIRFHPDTHLGLFLFFLSQEKKMEFPKKKGKKHTPLSNFVFFFSAFAEAFAFFFHFSLSLSPLFFVILFSKKNCRSFATSHNIKENITKIYF